MTPQQCHAKVIEINTLTHDVKEIVLEIRSPERLIFKAGQYIAIEVTEMRHGQPRQNNRPYSIASAPEEETVIRLCVNLVSGGPGSGYLHSLQIGDEISFLYPFGYFTMKTDSSASLLFVATGTGIAPIYSMIAHLINSGHQGKMMLYWGLRSERDLYYQDVLAALSERCPSFQSVTTLSQPSQSWRGAKGRVTANIVEVIKDVDHLEAYLCGNMEMIREVRAILLEKGMEKKSIHFEKFY